jgi:hypothetical protein
MKTCTRIEDPTQHVVSTRFWLVLVADFDAYSFIEIHLLEPLLAYFHGYLFIEDASHTSQGIVTYLEALPHHVERCWRVEECPRF